MILQHLRACPARRAGYVQLNLRCLRYYTDKPHRRSHPEPTHPYYLDAPIQPKSVHREDEKRTMPVGFGNQHVAVSDDKRRMLERVFNSFRAPIRYGFAYGSGVFKQTGYSDKVGDSPER